MAVITKKPGVELDLNELFDFIAQDKLEPAERFLRVAAESFARLAAMPAMGRRWASPNPRLRDVRVYPMPAPFRSYLIFYQPLSNGIDVLCVLHGARDLDHVLARRT